VKWVRYEQIREGLRRIRKGFCSLLLPDIANLTWPLIMADLSNAQYSQTEIATNLFLFFLLSSQEKYFD